VIAEIKKASPSKGIIRDNFNPAEIAQQYEAAGAACLSVLTDVDFFQGHDDNIQIARTHCNLPALRKDFLIDPYGVIEARALHADCILLIVACLSDQQLEEMSKTAFEHNLDVLVEVHDEAELERALQLSERCLLGVNNRNLKTFDVDLNTSLRLKQLLEPSRLLVTESGIATPDDVAMMQTNDIHAFLVGESFMKQPRPDHAFTALFGQPQLI
jgi:indole-3-glycerol phosphate synthase